MPMPTSRDARVPVRRGPRGVRGGVYLSGVQRVGLLGAAAVAVDEYGYADVTVAHIAACAKISRRTFYQLFDGREQCLLAVLESIERQLTSELQAAGLAGLEWCERVRMGLWTVLRFFDREPVMARFCVVESARGDERMAAYRAGLLARVAGVIAEGSGETLGGVEVSPLVAEGIAGAVVSILATRLSAGAGAGRGGAGRARKGTALSAPLTDLLGELMGLIVLPYRGPKAALAQRARPAPAEPETASSETASLLVPAPAGEQGGRVTYRTALVLEAIARAPGTSNLGVASHAQISDQGQVSKLLSRLQRNGLVRNTGRRRGKGAPNEWHLTPLGERVVEQLAQDSDVRGQDAA
jgi:AcrR family transcriptional regulator